MSKTIRQCVMCATKYEHCGHCGGTPELWKNIFCSENCRDIYDVLNKYEGRLISKEDAAEKLKAFNLSVVSKFNDRFQKLAKELTPKKKVPTKTKKNEQKVDEKKEDEVLVVAPKKKSTRTRSRKINNEEN